MKIRYKGGRSVFEVSINRKPYYFNQQNGRVLDTKDQNVINYIFGLPNRQEFEAVEDASPSPVSPTVIVPKYNQEDIKKKPGRPKKENK